MNLYQDVVFRGLDALRGRRNIERLRFLRRSQFWSHAELTAWQLRHLNRLLRVARKHSPFHGERLAQEAPPLASIESLQQLPVLTKADVREHRESIRTDHLPAGRYSLSHTGGSTGEPTFFYLDRRGRDWNRGSVYRSSEWAGTALGRRLIDVSGSVHDRRSARRMRKRLANAMLRHEHFPLVAPGPDTFERLRRRLHAYRPHSLWGYTSGLAGLAEHIEARHPGDTFPGLTAVVTSSETLLPEQRATLERVFGAERLFDHYGSREMYIAAQCGAHDGYHVHADVVLLEIVDAAGAPCPPGRPGRVLLTDLSNHAFPFIRYEIGDVATWAEPGECPCGVNLPRLASVEGRIPDMVVLPDRVLTPPNFVTPLSECPGVRAFQVQQPRIDHLRVIVEADDGFDDAVRRRILRTLERLVDGQARVEIVTDEPIQVPASGKRRFVVSDVTSGDDGDRRAA